VRSAAKKKKKDRFRKGESAHAAATQGRGEKDEAPISEEECGPSSGGRRSTGVHGKAISKARERAPIPPKTDLLKKGQGRGHQDIREEFPR